MIQSSNLVFDARAEPSFLETNVQLRLIQWVQIEIGAF